MFQLILGTRGAYIFVLIILIGIINTKAQSDTSSLIISDLPSLSVSAYSTRTDMIRLPAAVQTIQYSLHTDLSLSFAKSFNQVAGLRLEERSPGSYRLSIRGSTLRSPFGVRNIKVYLDGFNLTDGGGNTYLQLLNPEQISKAEILKGPASSMYGAGTGGAVLLHSDYTKNEVSLGYGSFDQWGESAKFNKKIGNWTIGLFQSHQQAKGYREQSSMRRDLIHLSQKYTKGKSILLLKQLYGDLYYQTPGGLNLDQYTKNRRQARPATPTLPSALTQNAGIYNKTVLLGSSYQYQLSPLWTINPIIQYWYTDFKNPFITNYETRYENNFSTRPTIQYHLQRNHTSYTWTSGIEYSVQNNLTRNFVNNKGEKGKLTSDAEINAIQSNVFSQFQYDYRKWQIMLGLSTNHQIFKYKTIQANDFTKKASGPVWMPRAAASYSLSNYKSLFISIAKGNSPPTLSEIRPSSGEYNQELLPEYGWNYELGYKQESKNIDFKANFYRMRLTNAIVRRNDAAGVEYFVNAGGANMNGIESELKWHTSWFYISTNIAYQPYKFVDYKQRTDDFNGKNVTGVPDFVWQVNSSLTISSYARLQFGFYKQSKLPLNDANTVYMNDYDLISASLVINPNKKVSVFLNGQFNLNGDYIPGPDINAAAARYYNAAATEMLSAGVKYKL